MKSNYEITQVTFVNYSDIKLLNTLVEDLLVLKVKKELLRNKRDCNSIGELIEIQEQIETKTNEVFGLVLASSLTHSHS